MADSISSIPNIPSSVSINPMRKPGSDRDPEKPEHGRREPRHDADEPGANETGADEPEDGLGSEDQDKPLLDEYA